MLISERTLSVYDLNEYVRKSLARDPVLHGIKIHGEISGFKCYPSGHWYFTLKDSQARISCVMFRQYNFMLPDIPRDGNQVILSGSVSLYSRDGSYQFYTESIQKDGLGALFKRFLELKEKLNSEGLFDVSVKKSIPLFPRRIGIATSRAGAVIHDFITVSGRRNPGVELVLCPVKVQGEGASEDLIRAIHELNELADIDVIIIGRGGGSIEDLWAFNDEGLVRAIRASRIPVVSAVGHETDFTLADFAADARAATPSQAAEMCVPDKQEMHMRLKKLKEQLAGHLRTVLYTMDTKLSEKKLKLLHLRPDFQLALRAKVFADTVTRLHSTLDKRINEEKERFYKASFKLYSMSPKAVLDRGYAIAVMENRVISDVNELYPGADFTLMIKNGSVCAQVRSIKGEGVYGEEGTNTEV
jgi:exodeoxyribonuclease VII large subunit